MVRKLLLGLLLLAPLGFFPFLRAKPIVVDSTNHLTDEHRLAVYSVGSSAGQTFPASVPWGLLGKMCADQSDELENLAKKDPVKFLDHCLARYENDVQGYRCIFWKQERVKGELKPYEKIRVHFREKPFSVHMNWLEGQELCIRSMYVEGERGNKLVARGLLFQREVFFLSERPTWGPDAQMTSRFPITRFGVYLGAKGTLQSIHEAQEKKTLHLEYLGLERVEKTGNRLCYKFLRTPFDPPEEGDEKLNEITIYIDRVTLLQVGSVLKNAKGEPIAEYFFRDVEINPTFDENQFTDKAM